MVHKLLSVQVKGAVLRAWELLSSDRRHEEEGQDWMRRHVEASKIKEMTHEMTHQMAT